MSFVSTYQRRQYEYDLDIDGERSEWMAENRGNDLWHQERGQRPRSRPWVWLVLVGGGGGGKTGTQAPEGNNKNQTDNNNRPTKLTSE